LDVSDTSTLKGLGASEGNKDGIEDGTGITSGGLFQSTTSL